MTRVMSIFMGKGTEDNGSPKQPGACEIYRITTPFTFMSQKSDKWVCEWAYFDFLFEQYKIGGMGAWLNLIDQVDIFVLPRFFWSNADMKQGYAALVGAIRAAGKRVVYEVDDDYTNRYRQVVDGDAITPAAWADAITVTTPYLAEMMRQQTGRPVYVLPNCIQPDMWRTGEAPKRTELTEGKVIIGLTGSVTHAKDWSVLKTVMPAILDKYPEVMFVVAGYNPHYLANLPRTHYLPGVKYGHYSQIIRGCDIILAPVDAGDLFNLGKSPIKAVEGQGAERKVAGQSAGAAVIATNNPIYSLAIKHRKTGLLVDQTPEAWLTAISELLDNPSLRTEIQIAGFRSAYRKFDASKEWVKWANAYNRILSSPANPVHITP